MSPGCGRRSRGRAARRSPEGGGADADRRDIWAGARLASHSVAKFASGKACSNIPLQQPPARANMLLLQRQAQDVDIHPRDRVVFV